MSLLFVVVYCLYDGVGLLLFVVVAVGLLLLCAVLGSCLLFLFALFVDCCLLIVVRCL